jgi:hypothetical protein
MSAIKTYELARLQRHGVWEHLGDFEVEEDAVESALEWARNDDTFRDDFGTAVFGISSDSSGHYETRVEVYEDGSHTVQ